MIQLPFIGREMNRPRVVPVRRHVIMKDPSGQICVVDEARSIALVGRRDHSAAHQGFPVNVCSHGAEFSRREVGHGRTSQVTAAHVDELGSVRNRSSSNYH